MGINLSSVATPTLNASVDHRSRGLARRYEDGYRVARWIIFFGKVIKVAGVIVALIVFLGGIAAADSAQSFAGNKGAFALLFSAGAAVVAGVSTSVWGFLISALGHLALASLDTAVNTSPFLNNDQRAGMMNLL